MTMLPGFRFGVATSAYQIEGAASEDGRGESIWDVFCRRPGAVRDGSTGDVACDHYHRWAEDLDLMRDLGVESYRFSISWPRVQPSGSGRANPRGLAFYRELVEGLLERRIEPIATLYHWDLPQALQDRGGWASRDTAERFAEYAGLAAEALGDLVDQWITHNEPWCAGFLGYAEGSKAPGMRHWPSALAATHHLLLSHGLAVPVLRTAVADPKVGIALNLAPVHPASASDADLDAARVQDGYLNRWFLDPLLRGRYPEDMVELFERMCGPLGAVRDGDLSVITAPIDFLGVNYYNPMRVRAAPRVHPLGVEHAEPRGEPTAMGWEVDPTGLHEVLARLHRDYGPRPIYITENGAAYDDPAPDGAGMVEDQARARYVEQHLAAVRQALGDGIDVRRYCLWSFLDNFEWEDGYGKRFGIVYVDYSDQRRIVKRSALRYRDYIAAARGTAPSGDRASEGAAGPLLHDPAAGPHDEYEQRD